MEDKIIEIKFGIGDKVRVVKYGGIVLEKKDSEMPFKHFPIIYEDDDFVYRDTCPEMVGREGLIDTVKLTQGKPRYSLEIKGKVAWYNEEQLEMINKNPNR